MKKILITAIIIIVVLLSFFFLKRNISQKSAVSPVPAAGNSTNPQNSPAGPPLSQAPNEPSSQGVFSSAGQNISSLQPPLDRAAERATKKPFGIYITPKNSPVQPEKFQGYHTGTDFEIFPDETDTDVPVRAICSGSIALKKYAAGYGGVLVQNCELNNQPITVIYGHLKLASIQKNTGGNMNTGDTIGILGKAYSQETDGERKHLHLGIHRGSSVNIRGYVSSQTELSGWIDPCLYVCK